MLKCCKNDQTAVLEKILDWLSNKRIVEGYHVTTAVILAKNAYWQKPTKIVDQSVIMGNPQPTTLVPSPLFYGLPLQHMAN